MGHENTPIRDGGRPQAHLGTACTGRQEELCDQIRLLRSMFLPTKVLRDFYFKVILPSVKYGLVLWGACCDSDLFPPKERLHCRSSRIIFNLPKDMASCDALGYDQWTTLFLYYKLDIFKLFYKAHNYACAL